MAASSSTSLLAALSSLSLRSHHHSSCHFTSFPFTSKPLFSLSSKPSPLIANVADSDTVYFDNSDPDAELSTDFTPPERPEDFIEMRSFDEPPFESEDNIAKAFEELYGPAYSGETFLGNNVYVMDAKVKKSTGFGSKTKKEKIRDGYEERVIQVRRVTKVVKGGKQLHFRAVVVVGDRKGNVGVGVGKAKEVVGAVQKSAVNARRNITTVPMTKYKTFPHR